MTQFEKDVTRSIATIETKLDSMTKVIADTNELVKKLSDVDRRLLTVENRLDSEEKSKKTFWGIVTSSVAILISVASYFKKI